MTSEDFPVRPMILYNGTVIETWLGINVSWGRDCQSSLMLKRPVVTGGMLWEKHTVTCSSRDIASDCFPLRGCSVLYSSTVLSNIGLDLPRAHHDRKLYVGEI